MDLPQRLFAITLLVLALAPTAGAQAALPPARFAFQGKMLVVACDTDMLPSAYVDGKLGPAVGPDVLSVIRLDRPGKLRAATVPVTNSVTGPPAAVAVTPDGRYAIVVETQGTRPSNKPDATMNDLAPGKKITVVDLADPDRPRVVQQIEAGERAVSVAINPAGTLVAVTFDPKLHTSTPLALYPFSDGRLGNATQPALPGYTATDTLVDAEFLPGRTVTSDILAINFGTGGDGTARSRLAFFEFTPNNATLRPWGNVLELDPSPFLVRFTSDGRFALVNAMHNFANGRGTVTSIRIAATVDANSTPQHSIVSRADTGELPEGLAVSPDGRWVATANLEGSYRPLTDPQQRFFGSVTLLRLDPATGMLTRVNDFPFDGMLPEPLVFDNSSRFLAVGNFSQFSDLNAGGTIEFFRITDNLPQPGRIELVHLNEALPVARGPQSMAIVR